MVFLLFILNLYFVATLGIAGLAKLDRPASFFSTLRYQYRFPDWSSGTITKIFPWIEIFLSLSLLLSANTIKYVVVITNLGLFLVFFLLHSMNYAMKKGTHPCGCYGKALQRSGIQSNMTTVSIQLVLAILLVCLTRFLVPLAYAYYLIGAVLFIAAYVWLGWKIWMRHKAVDRTSVR